MEVRSLATTKPRTVFLRTTLPSINIFYAIRGPCQHVLPRRQSQKSPLRDLVPRAALCCPMLPITARVPRQYTVTCTYLRTGPKLRYLPHAILSVAFLRHYQKLSQLLVPNHPSSQVRTSILY